MEAPFGSYVRKRRLKIKRWEKVSFNVKLFPPYHS